jgi:Ca-activated chloride channel family protein
MKKGGLKMKTIILKGIISVFIWLGACAAYNKNKPQPLKRTKHLEISKRKEKTYAKQKNKIHKLKVSSLSRLLKKTDGKIGKQYIHLAHYSPSLCKEKDKTLSPYFFVPDGDPDIDQLPLKETTADVTIAGVIAKVRIRQVFENKSKKPIEAIYVFPASTRAAVHAMRMKIGKRIIKAKIEERKKARKKYEQAKKEGKRASLLEQQRPNVFTMNVANIMPKDKIEVQLDYTELLVPEDSVYEFVYPTVVGPRYGGGADKNKDKWIENPYLRQGKKETYKFDIKVKIESAIPIKKIFSPSHRININYLSQKRAKIQLDEDGGGNRDFIIRYTLAGKKIETGTLLYSHKHEKFFIVMIEPPLRPSASQIPPREYIFVLDVSGSMYGFPLETAKELIKQLISNLRSGDYFNLVLFSGASYVMSERSLPVTSSNINQAIAIIERQRGGGGTELMQALRSAYSIPKVQAKGISRTVVVITDGYVGVEAQVFKFIRKNLNEANLFAFGIGSSVNRALIEGMARAGIGESFIVLKPDEASKKADKFRRYIEQPVLTDISVKFHGFKTYDIAPEQIPDLMAQRPIIIFGKYAGAPKGKIQIKGITGKGRFIKTIEITEEALKKANSPIRYIWARKWVEILSDQLAVVPKDADLKQAITTIGLYYSLLTPFTSFVAIDTRVVRRGEKLETVKQPLPLPQGVSDLAVGDKYSGYGYLRYRGSGRVRRRPLLLSTPSQPSEAAEAPLLVFKRMPKTQAQAKKTCHRLVKSALVRKIKVLSKTKINTKEKDLLVSLVNSKVCQCIKKEEISPGTKLSVEVTLTFSQKGEIKSISLSKPKYINKRCLKRRLKKSLSNQRYYKGLKIQISLELFF